MSDCVADLSFGQSGLELPGLLGGNIAGAPLIAVLREELEALATGLASPLGRLFVSPRN
jgi:hypothetical protein